jgi:hypothetical protein
MRSRSVLLPSRAASAGYGADDTPPARPSRCGPCLWPRLIWGLALQMCVSVLFNVWISLRSHMRLSLGRPLRPAPASNAE